MMNTILAIRLRQLGDVLATLSAIKAIKTADHRRRILFMIDEQYHDLLKEEWYIDEIMAPPPMIGTLGDMMLFSRYIDDMRRRKISCVLDFHSNPRSALLAFLSGAPRRIGFDVRIRKMFYTEIEPRARWRGHARLPWTSLQSAHGLARRVGVAELDENSLPEIKVAEDDVARARKMLEGIGAKEGSVGINPGNPYPSKAWPEECFSELSRLLTQSGREVVIMWGPGEKPKAERIKREAGKGVYLSPSLALAELPGFLRNLAVLVTIDSGLKHLAVSARVPTVTLFGPTSPDEWHMGTPRDVYLSSQLSCSPCRLLKCPFDSPCMKAIAPCMVMESIENVLQEQIAQSG